MQATLANLRAAVFERCDWNPNPSTAAINRCNAAINEALRSVRTEAPSLFHKAEWAFWTKENYNPDSDDTVSVYEGSAGYRDPWVLVRDDANSALSSEDILETDGTRTGDIIYITASDGVVHRREIRSISNVLYGSPAVLHQFIVIDQPWINQTDEELEWRIVTEAIPVPWWIGRISTIAPRGQSPNQLEMLPATLRNGSGRSSDYINSYPDRYFGRVFQLGRREIARPRTAPGVQSISGTLWVGPTPPGTYTFKTTLVYGFHDARHGFSLPSEHESPISGGEGPADYRRLHPKYESAPSPVSASVSSTASGGNFTSILLTFNDQEHSLGFGHPDTGRYHRSGLYTAIYAKRTANASYSSSHPGTTARPTGYSVTYASPSVNLDPDDNWYLLDIIPANQYEYVFDGRQVLEYSRSCPTATSQKVLSLEPVFGDKEWQLTGVYTPEEMTDDTQELKAEPDVADVVVLRAALTMCPKSDADLLNSINIELRRKSRELSKIAGVIPNNQPTSRIIRDYT
jgi:hypothetical protein